jgi:hypothetical protein
METKQLNGYKIEFYSFKEYSEILSNNLRGKNIDLGIYAGKVSEISEELAGSIVEFVHGVNNIGYRDYLIKTMVSTKDTAKESFQTLSDLEYCVINKIN